jgi:hypothetical protein
MIKKTELSLDLSDCFNFSTLTLLFLFIFSCLLLALTTLLFATLPFRELIKMILRG